MSSTEIRSGIKLEVPLSVCHPDETEDVRHIVPLDDARLPEQSEATEAELFWAGRLPATRLSARVAA
jgi:hypothetical protein